MLLSEAKRSRGLLGYSAVQSGSIELVQAVFLEVGKELLLDMKEVHGVISAAASLGSIDMWEASIQAVTNLCGDLLSKTVCQDPSVVLGAIGSKDPTIVRAMYSFVRKLLPPETDSEGFGKFIAAGFSQWTDVVREEQEHSPDVGTGGLGWAIDVLSCFLEYPAVLDPKDVVNLSRYAPEGWIRTCFLDTVAYVENPFVAGITLSVSLAEAAVVAPQGERRKLLSVQTKLDNLLLEVLERLPQTVHGFGLGGMEICQALFEPSVSVEGAREGLGPLRMILRNRGHMETFATQPLIVDF
ncbi:unnamed protein product [Ectocarpus sp. 12 AP-2014]